VPRVGLDDNFFSLGGDSLQVLRIQTEAERQGLSLKASDILQHPTLRLLAGRVTATAPARAKAEQASVPFGLLPESEREALRGYEDAFPASRLQLGMLYHGQAHADSSLYHDVFTYHLKMGWDAERFRGALELVVAAHPALRSSFDLG